MVAMTIISVMSMLVYFFIWAINNYQNNTNATQRAITDSDLVRLFHQQPDGFLSPHRLAEITDLKLSEARQRLVAFNAVGILKKSHNKRGRYFYSLREPFQEPPTVAFSPDPFLTVEDLLQLFDAYGGRISIQDMILATRLPLKVLMREMKHFEKEKIVEQLKTSEGAYSTNINKFYVLQDPYRTDPNAFRKRAGEVDLKLKELLKNENLII